MLLADSARVPDPALVKAVSVLMIPEISDAVLVDVMDNVPTFAIAPLISVAPEPELIFKLCSAYDDEL